MNTHWIFNNIVELLFGGGGEEVVVIDIMVMFIKRKSLFFKRYKEKYSQII